MFRALIVTGALLSASAPPALAADWYVLNPLNQPVVSPEAISRCIVVNRPAQPGEQQIAGPFTSEQAGLNSLRRYGACIYARCAVSACSQAGN
jgi:hypothetical protein